MEKATGETKEVRNNKEVKEEKDEEMRQPILKNT